MFDFTLPKNSYEMDSDITDLVKNQLERLNKQEKVHVSRNPLRVETRAIHRYQAQVAVEGFRFISDEALKSGGSDLGPAPARYFVAGLVLCIQVWIVKMMALEGVPMTSLRCQAESTKEVGHDKDAPAERGFGGIQVTVFVDTDWNDRDDDVCSTVAAGVQRCPVAITVGRGTDLQVAVVHNDRALGNI